MDDNDWAFLVRQIRKGNCTPFLGAGINEPHLPLGRELAQELAKRYKYPFDDNGDLIRVAQYIATTKGDPMRSKQEVLAMLEDRLKSIKADELDPQSPIYAADSPLGILADLPFSAYLTTNYDPLIHNALLSRKRASRREYCRWNGALTRPSNAFPEPTVEEPVVFHLHGADSKDTSLVLTEDDYVSFLVNLRQDIIPPFISEKLSGCMLFIGYSLQDWDFRVLHQALASAREAAVQHGSMSVQVRWEQDAEKRELTESFLNKYFGDRHISVYWGSAKQFLAELMVHWRKQ